LLRKKKWLEAGFPEVHVGRQDMQNSVTVHHTETQTINKRVALVGMPAKKTFSLIQCFGIGIDRPKRSARGELIEKGSDQVRYSSGH